MADVRARAFEALKAVYNQPKPEQEDERGVGGDETVSEALSKEIFSQYVCRCDSAHDVVLIAPCWCAVAHNGILTA